LKVSNIQSINNCFEYFQEITYSYLLEATSKAHTLIMKNPCCVKKI